MPDSRQPRIEVDPGIGILTALDTRLEEAIETAMNAGATWEQVVVRVTMMLADYRGGV
jgi:hypothetical protein